MTQDAVSNILIFQVVFDCDLCIYRESYIPSFEIMWYISSTVRLSEIEGRNSYRNGNTVRHFDGLCYRDNVQFFQNTFQDLQSSILTLTSWTLSLKLQLGAMHFDFVFPLEPWR